MLDRSARAPNPASEWLSELAWDSITELDKLPKFKGLAASFEQSGDEWRDWYQSTDPPPEKLKPVGEWRNRWDEFQQMLVLRVLRPDRVVFSARSFIEHTLGKEVRRAAVLTVGTRKLTPTRCSSPNLLCWT